MDNFGVVWPILQHLLVAIVLGVVWKNGIPGKDQALVKALVIYAAAVWIQFRLDNLDKPYDDLYSISKTSITMTAQNLRARLQNFRQLTTDDLDTLKWLDSLGPDAGRIYRLLGPAGMRCSWCALPQNEKVGASYLTNFQIYAAIVTLCRLAIDFFAVAFAGAICIHSSRWFKTQCLLLLPPALKLIIRYRFYDSWQTLGNLTKVCEHVNVLAIMAILTYKEGTAWAANRKDAPENVLARANSVLAQNIRTFAALDLLATVKRQDESLAKQDHRFWARRHAQDHQVWTKVEADHPPADADVKLSEGALGLLVTMDGSQSGYTLSGIDYGTTRRLLRLPAA